VLHALFIAFVVVGLLLIVAGVALRWNWVRNFWFRAAHLLAIGFVVIQAWTGGVCPLTIWENDLRQLAGQETYQVGFIAHWLHKMIFYQAEPWVFNLCYTIFGGLVLATYIFARPRWPGRATESLAHPD
ncbi:MAG: DUF2784 domain-containing protein, partial [Phycisphaerae bacterium]|nr:DUF2784 domain-containing protein [Phycisphaerae bacterium]